MTVLILGAGVMQIPAIRIAKEKGWRVAAADGNPKAAGAGLADIFFPVDLKDLDGLEKAARSLAAPTGKNGGGLDAVFTAGTDFSYSAAWLARKLGLPGIPPEAALRASNKLEMRAALAAAGVPSPGFTAIGAGMDIQTQIRSAGLELPLVVKPADSMGARGCSLASNPEALAGAVADAVRYSRVGKAIVEEYMAGPEFSIDALVDDGSIRICGFADRHIYFAPYFVELGHTMPSACSNEIKNEVLRVFEAGVKAIGITRGAAKGDMKWCPKRGTAMVGEIAARLSGGYMSGWTYPYASGIEVTSEALELAAGGHLPPVEPDRGWVSAERAFISIPGRTAAVLGARDAETSPYIKNVFYRVGPGDPCVFPMNNVQKCGNVISQAPTRELAVQASEEAAAGILVRLEPRAAETDSFLLGEGRISGPDGGFWPPEAFELPSSALDSIRKFCGYADFASALSSLKEASPAQRGPAACQAHPVLAGFDDLFGRGAAVGSLKDWSGRTFAGSAELAARLGGAVFSSGPLTLPRDRSLSALFWLALAKGGAQAALYVLDSEACA